MQDPGLPPSSSSRIFLAYGPWTPDIESKTKVKSGRAMSFLIWPKSKHSFNRDRWSSTVSKTSMMRSSIVKLPGFDRSTTGTAWHILISVILAVHSTILPVTFSGAGPPFSQLYLMPKSSVMPPGLCEAEQMKPPKGSKPPPRERITAETAGVESNPPVPSQMRPTPLASAICMMICMASLFQYRPSPETTSVPPSTGVPSESKASKTLCTKLWR
mmetsp:Transcript_20420/g.44524  ORF Transcript_20420/g.44524 Transcript_20420/m.44524 type:complete len:215 (+) Transcript_20420:1080-1724(+)